MNNNDMVQKELVIIRLRARVEALEVENARLKAAIAKVGTRKVDAK